PQAAGDRSRPAPCGTALALPAHPHAGRLHALVSCPSDGLGPRAHAEFGFEARQPLAHGVKAHEQLPRDRRLVLHRRSTVQHFSLAFVDVYNARRPHEALDFALPIARYLRPPPITLEPAILDAGQAELIYCWDPDGPSDPRGFVRSDH